MFGMHLPSGMQKVLQTVSTAVHVRIHLGVYSGPWSFFCGWQSLGEPVSCIEGEVRCPLTQSGFPRENFLAATLCYRLYKVLVRTEEGRENALEKERKLQLYRLKKLGVKCRTNVPQTIWWRAEYRGDSTLQIHTSTNMSVSDGADKRGNSMTWLMAGLGILHRLHPLCYTLALCEWLQMAEGCASLQRAMITVINWEWEPRRTTMDQQNGPVKSVPCQAGKGHDAREKGSEYQLFLWCADV